MHDSAGRGINRAGGAEPPEDYGGPHVLVYGRCEPDATTDRRWNAWSFVLLRFPARQFGALSARRKRHLGPGAARSFDHGLSDQRETRSRGCDRRETLER